MATVQYIDIIGTGGTALAACLRTRITGISAIGCRVGELGLAREASRLEF
ncbi:MAG: hypothetical protein AAFZ02_12085 [Pseudomonadota bacterium]